MIEQENTEMDIEDQMKTFNLLLAKDQVDLIMEHSDNKEFPMNFPNPRIRELVDKVSSVQGYRKDYLLIGLCMAVSAVMGKKISLKDRAYINYPSLWVILLGTAGVNKSSPLHWAFAPVEELITQYAEEYRKQLIAYNDKHDKNTPYPICKELILKDTTNEKRLMIYIINDNNYFFLFFI